MDNKFVTKLAVKTCKENLGAEQLENIEKEVAVIRESLRNNGFTFASDKTSLIKDVDRMDQLELLHYSNRDRFQVAMSELSLAINDFLTQNNISTSDFVWSFIEESEELNVDSISCYDFFVAKYYNALRESLWKDDYNTAIDSSSALFNIAFKDIK